MSNSAELFCCPCFREKSEDRGFGGAMTPELSGALDHSNVRRDVHLDITRGHVLPCPTIGSCHEKCCRISGATNNLQFGPFNLSYQIATLRVLGCGPTLFCIC